MSFEPIVEGLTALDAAAAGAAPLAMLPADVVLSERAAALLRAYLLTNGLDGYRIFYCDDLDLEDVDAHLAELGETSAAWEPIGPGGMTIGGEGLNRLASANSSAPRLDKTGCLRLPRHEIVLARWQWLSTDQCISLRRLWLCAAASVQRYVDLRQKLRRLRRDGATAVWQIVRGYSYADGTPLPRTPAVNDGLVLDPSLRRRIEVDVLSFFTEPVAQLYRSLGVAYRRGVLMHGPPGNGKTSMIRLIGASLPRVPAMLLRPLSGFDDDDLQQVVTRWSRQAPAMLVIEDLNWLLKTINVSTFLNLLDGIESPSGAGLLLLATTNYPEQLDPAINNRPGRFDVVIHVASPNAAMRQRFFDEKLKEMSAAPLAELVRLSDGFSFAHLQEVLRLSGLLAIHDGRNGRSAEDMLRAARQLRESTDDAGRGFRERPEVPFGLAQLHKMNKAIEP